MRSRSYHGEIEEVEEEGKRKTKKKRRKKNTKEKLVIGHT